MVPAGLTSQLRRDHTADRPVVSRVVCMTAYGLEHGAGVETRAAANATQTLGQLWVAVQFGTSIVEQHDVQVLGSVHFLGQ